MVNQLLEPSIHQDYLLFSRTIEMLDRQWVGTCDDVRQTNNLMAVIQAARVIYPSDTIDGLIANGQKLHQKALENKRQIAEYINEFHDCLAGSVSDLPEVKKIDKVKRVLKRLEQHQDVSDKAIDIVQCQLIWWALDVRTAPLATYVKAPIDDDVIGYDHQLINEFLTKYQNQLKKGDIKCQ